MPACLPARRHRRCARCQNDLQSGVQPRVVLSAKQTSHETESRIAKRLSAHTQPDPTPTQPPRLVLNHYGPDLNETFSKVGSLTVRSVRHFFFLLSVSLSPEMRSPACHRQENEPVMRHVPRGCGGAGVGQ